MQESTCKSTGITWLLCCLQLMHAVARPGACPARPRQMSAAMLYGRTSAHAHAPAMPTTSHGHPPLKRSLKELVTGRGAVDGGLAGSGAQLGLGVDLLQVLLATHQRDDDQAHAQAAQLARQQPAGCSTSSQARTMMALWSTTACRTSRARPLACTSACVAAPRTHPDGCLKDRGTKALPCTCANQRPPPPRKSMQAQVHAMLKLHAHSLACSHMRIVPPPTHPPTLCKASRACAYARDAFKHIR